MRNDEWRMENGEWRMENLERFSRESHYFFLPNSPFSPIHLFFNFPKLLNSYFLSFPSRSALIRVYPRQKIPFLFSIFSFPQLFSSFLFQTAKLLPFKLFSRRKMSYFSFGRAHWHTSHRWWLRFPEANWKAWFFQEAGIW